MESIYIGELSQTHVVITYIDGIATDSVVEEVRKEGNQDSDRRGARIRIYRRIY